MRGFLRMSVARCAAGPMRPGITVPTHPAADPALPSPRARRRQRHGLGRAGYGYGYSRLRCRCRLRQDSLQKSALVPEIADWKQKYRDALRESEREEKRWRQIEQALRQLIGRLCAAGMGVNPQLDDQLVAIAAANRRNADAAELARLAASLTTAVAAVDAVSPVAGGNTTLIVALPWTSTHRTAGTIVHSLGALGVEEEISLALADELTRAHSDAAVAAVLSKAAELIQGLRRNARPRARPSHRRALGRDQAAGGSGRLPAGHGQRGSSSFRSDGIAQRYRHIARALASRRGQRCDGTRCVAGLGRHPSGSGNAAAAGLAGARGSAATG